MFSKFAVFALSATVLAAATPAPQTSSVQCNPESLLCCQEILSSATPTARGLAANYGVASLPPLVLVGFSCASASLVFAASTGQWYAFIYH